MDCEKVVLEMARMRRTIWNWNGFNQLKNVEEVKSVCTDSGMLSWKMWITVEKKKNCGKRPSLGNVETISKNVPSMINLEWFISVEKCRTSMSNKHCCE